MVSRHHHAPPYSDLPLPPASAPGQGRAQSVTSGRSATRRHRHGRSHHGGSVAYTPQNEFPVFALTGDVEIIISTVDGKREKRYVLHKLFLSQYSGFFAASTSAEWSKGGAEGARGLVTIAEGSAAGSISPTSSTERRPSYDSGPLRRRWRYELDWETAGEDEAPMLVQKEPTAASSIFGGDGAPPPIRSHPPTSHDGFFKGVSNFSSLSLSSEPIIGRGQPDGRPADAPGDEVLKDYDNLFRTMYQQPPMIDTLNIATAYTESKALLHLADMYDCLEIVGPRVDHHLLRFGTRLFKQIAKYPPSYLKLGFLARSKGIFTEALIHVVGQWPLAAPQLRGILERDPTELLLDKVEDLEDEKTRAERKLWRLTLTTSRGERVTPSNDYLAWLATSLFRQWLADRTTLESASVMKSGGRPSTGSQVSASNGATRRSTSRSDNHAASQRTNTSRPPAPTQPPAVDTGKVFLLIGSMDRSTYLGYDELKRFLKLQPDLYTRDNLKRFERRMDDLKDMARDIVRPLMDNYLQLDLSRFGPAGLGHLTCTKITEADLPWDR